MEDKEKKDISMEKKENPEKISGDKGSDLKKENISEDKNKFSKDNQEKPEKGFFAKLKDRFWIITTIVLAIIVIILLFMSLGGDGLTGSAVSSEAAGDNLLGFAESQGIEEAELANIESFNDYFYKATLLMEGQELPVFLTKDGKYMVTEPVPLDDSEPEVVDQNPQQETEPSTSYSEEETAELKEFNDCLADEGLVIYGSETCPHCQNLVETLGGYDAVSSIYVECMEDQQRCSEEMEGQGVPEIQINGEKFDEGRSIEVLAEATGCPVPEVQA